MKLQSMAYKLAYKVHAKSIRSRTMLKNYVHQVASLRTLCLEHAVKAVALDMDVWDMFEEDLPIVGHRIDIGAGE